MRIVAIVIQMLCAAIPTMMTPQIHADAQQDIHITLVPISVCKIVETDQWLDMMETVPNQLNVEMLLYVKIQMAMELTTDVDVQMVIDSSAS